MGSVPVRNDESDLFIAHASEDKIAIARPLSKALVARGWSVWLDELELTIGDSLSGRIDSALARSRFGVVVLSTSFFAKPWPQRELAGLAAREVSDGVKVILPVWHGVGHSYIAQRSPVLADRLGVLTSAGIEHVADEISLALERGGVSPATARTSASGSPRAVLDQTRPGARGGAPVAAQVINGPPQVRERPAVKQARQVEETSAVKEAAPINDENHASAGHARTGVFVPEIPPGGTKLARPATKRRRALLAACLGVVTMVVVAAAVIVVTSGGDATVANAQVALTPAYGWRASPAALSPDTSLIASPVTLRDGSATLSAGLLIKSDAVPGGPPPALVALLGAPVSAEATSIDGQQAHRYAWNAARSQVIAVVLASWSSDLTLICRAPAPAMRQCLRIVQSARLRLVIEPPGANVALAGALARAKSSLLTSRAGARALYGRDPVAQAKAARIVAAGDHSATATLAGVRVPPRNRQLIADVLAALTADASAYESVATALDRGQSSSYRSSLARVSATDSRLSSTLERLSTQGLGRISLAPRPVTPSLSVIRRVRPRPRAPSTGEGALHTAESQSTKTSGNGTPNGNEVRTTVQKREPPPHENPPSKLEQSKAIEGTAK